MSDLLLLVDGSSHLLLTDGSDLLLASSSGATPAPVDYPTVTVEFSPTTGPFDTPVWLDITHRVLHAEWVDGKQADLGEFPPGQCTITLTNEDRAFDPEHAAGFFYGLLNPRVPFRIRATYDAVTYDLFYGFVEDGWRQIMDPPAVAECEVTLVDLLGVLHGYTLPSVLEAEILADGPVDYWRLDETSGTDMVDRSGAHRDGTYKVGTVGVSTVAESAGGAKVRGLQLDGDHHGSVTDATAAVTDRPQVVEALIIPDKDLATGGRTIYVAGTGTSGEGVIFNVAGSVDQTTFAVYGTVRDGDPDNSAFGPYLELTDGIRHVALRRPAAAASEVYVDGVEVTDHNGTTTSTGALAVGVIVGTQKLSDAVDGFHGFLAHVAVYDSDIGAVRIAAHADAAAYPLDGETSGVQIAWVLDQIGVPAGMRDLDAGVSIMGPADTAGKDALAFMREVAATEQGDLYVAHHDGGKLRFRDRYASFQDARSTAVQATFSDDPAVADTAACRVLPGSLVVEPNGVDSIINQAAVTWVGGEEVVDASTGSPYGPRPVSIRTQAANPATARGIGQWIVANNAVPAAKIKALTVHPGANPLEFPMTLATRVADRAAYRSHPQSAGSATTKQLEVLGRRHRIEGVDWVATFYLTEHPDIGVDLFTLGTSQLGGSHILAY